MLIQGIDTVVLGCTHYPFVIPLIQSIVGPAVRVIDPAPAVARQVRRVYQSFLEKPASAGESPGSTASLHYLTTGDPAVIKHLLHTLDGVDPAVEQIVLTS